jgi:hypothetical protein
MFDEYLPLSIKHFDAWHEYMRAAKRHQHRRTSVTAFELDAAHSRLRYAEQALTRFHERIQAETAALTIDELMTEAGNRR